MGSRSLREQLEDMGHEVGRGHVITLMKKMGRPLDEWGKLVGDVPTATAILDRFLSRADIIQITGKSYRLRDNGCKNKKENEKIIRTKNGGV